VTDWKPIATAPKDGRRIIVTLPNVKDFNNKDSWTLARWREDFRHWEFSDGHHYSDETTGWLGFWTDCPDLPEIQTNYKSRFTDEERAIFNAAWDEFTDALLPNKIFDTLLDGDGDDGA
jgi:hypothetical protein